MSRICDWLSDQDKESLKTMLENHGTLGVCAAMCEWWDSFKDGTKDDYERAAKEMCATMENTLSSLG